MEESTSLSGVKTLRLVDGAQTSTTKKTTTTTSKSKYTEQQLALREKYKTTANVYVISATDNTSLASMDDNKDGKDDGYVNSLKAADKSDMHVLKVTDITDLITKLKALKDEKNIRIGNLYFRSHGAYTDPSFYIGSHYNEEGKWTYKNRINSGNVSKLKKLAPVLDENTKVIIMACHTGGGKDTKLEM